MDFDDWREACRWVADSSNIPPGARFLTPRLAQTFKWYTGHPSVVDWKDVPQDAKDLVEWWRRMQDVFGNDEPPAGWRRSLDELGPERLAKLGNDYHADYVITKRTDPPLAIDVLHENRSYIIYRLR